MTRHTPEQRWDHRRDLQKHEWRPGDPLPLDQRCALALLVGYCEGITKSGVLGDEVEAKFRQHIAGVLTAFNMPSKHEVA